MKHTLAHLDRLSYYRQVIQTVYQNHLIRSRFNDFGISSLTLKGGMELCHEVEYFLHGRESLDFRLLKKGELEVLEGKAIYSEVQDWIGGMEVFSQSEAQEICVKVQQDFIFFHHNALMNKMEQVALFYSQIKSILRIVLSDRPDVLKALGIRP